MGNKISNIKGTKRSASLMFYWLSDCNYWLSCYYTKKKQNYFDNYRYAQHISERAKKVQKASTICITKPIKTMKVTTADLQHMHNIVLSFIAKNLKKMYYTEKVAKKKNRQSTRNAAKFFSNYSTKRSQNTPPVWNYKTFCLC